MEHITRTSPSDKDQFLITMNSLIKENYLQYTFIDHPLKNMSTSPKIIQDDDSSDWYNESPI